ARALLLRCGPVFDFSTWGAREEYEKHFRRSGAEREILRARELEKNRNLERAEATYLSFEPNKTNNGWLRGFYIRHRMYESYLAQEGASDLNAPVESEKSMNAVSSLCILYPVFGD